MRRSVGFALGTVAGAGLLVGAKLGTHVADASDSTRRAVAVVVADAPPGTGPVVNTGRALSTPTARHAPKPSSHPTAVGSTAKPHSSTTAKPGRTPAPGETPMPASPGRSGPRNGTYTASAEVGSGQYGTLTMTVTITGHRVTAITASEASPTEPNCYQSACPALNFEALKAQNASVVAVSGATYTSAAYMSALTAVLSAARA